MRWAWLSLVGGCVWIAPDKESHVGTTGDSSATADTVDSGEPPLPVDGDGDGHASDVDCDDTDADVHPGADELCSDDGADRNCDGDPDAGATDAITVYADTDGDGFGTGEPQQVCGLEEGTSTEDGDCDDSNDAVHPGAEESPCDGVDADCDGVDESPGSASCPVASCADFDPSSERTDGVWIQQSTGAVQVGCEAGWMLVFSSQLVSGTADRTDPDPAHAPASFWPEGNMLHIWEPEQTVSSVRFACDHDQDAPADAPLDFDEVLDPAVWTALTDPGNTNGLHVGPVPGGISGSEDGLNMAGGNDTSTHSDFYIATFDTDIYAYPLMTWGTFDDYSEDIPNPPDPVAWPGGWRDYCAEPATEGEVDRAVPVTTEGPSGRHYFYILVR